MSKSTRLTIVALVVVASVVALACVNRGSTAHPALLEREGSCAASLFRLHIAFRVYAQEHSGYLPAPSEQDGGAEYFWLATIRQYIPARSIPLSKILKCARDSRGQLPTSFRMNPSVLGKRLEEMKGGLRAPLLIEDERNHYGYKHVLMTDGSVLREFASDHEATPSPSGVPVF